MLTILAICCFGIGELMLVPAIFALIAQLAPKNLHATLVGVFFLFAAFGAYLSSTFGTTVKSIVHYITQQPVAYSKEFMTTAIIMLGVAFVFGLIIRLGKIR